MFELMAGGKIGHIALSDIADQMVIAPATANMIGKVANGIADDFLTTMVMATRVPVLFVPSMNTKMWESSIVQGNIEKLRENGYQFMEPASGDLACGWQGKGRLPPIEDIVEQMEDIFTEKDYLDQRVLVTAGPTIEFIDPVRCITNRSSGKMGYAIAKIARRRGAEVVLVTGITSLPPPRNDIRAINVVTAEQMRAVVMEEQRRASVIIKAAAVADYRCKEESCEKIKKKIGRDEITLTLTKNPDILEELGRIIGDRVLVGFAAETENVVEHARDKLRRKHLDLIVANDVSKSGIGFGADDNEVTIIDAGGRAIHVPQLSKDEIAPDYTGRGAQGGKKEEKDRRGLVLKHRFRSYSPAFLPGSSPCERGQAGRGGRDRKQGDRQHKDGRGGERAERTEDHESLQAIFRFRRGR